MVLRNDRASFYVGLVGVGMLVMGIIAFIFMNAVILGNEDIQGLIPMANESFNISNQSGSEIEWYTNVWAWWPLWVFIAFMVYVLKHSQWGAGQ